MQVRMVQLDYVLIKHNIMTEIISATVVLAIAIAKKEKAIVDAID